MEPKEVTHSSITLDDVIEKYKPHEVDFVFPSKDDTKVYLDLYLLYHSPDIRWHKVHALVFAYFNHHLNLYRNAKISDEDLIDKLHFPEVSLIGLGHCASGVEGAGSGDDRAVLLKEAIFDNEEINKVGISALASVSITIGGFGPDLISDLVANFGIQYLLEYTDEQVRTYGLKTAEYPISRILDPTTFSWNPLLKAKLPYFSEDGEPRILVPQHLVRKLPFYTTQGFYHNYLKYLLQEEKGSRLKSIKTIASEPKVPLYEIEEELKRKYETVGDATRTIGLNREELLEDYIEHPLKYKKNHTREKKEKINWSSYSNQLKAIKPGKESAYEYADMVRKIFTALYSGGMVNGSIEKSSDGNMFHYDVTFGNSADTTFFQFLRNQKLKTGLLVVEAKNYKKTKVGNQQFNQANGYSIPGARDLVFIVTREEITKKQIDKSRRYFLTHRVLLLPISDKDIEALLSQRKDNKKNFDTLLVERAQQILEA